ncbi:hypothetical protein [Bradyrhizobium monzae]|uniref:hypothetical protein n=1 Tax=Bradyrhizobium sp. Oc8 TaxID=2876780 RepID=UPI001F260DEC|nr:hypothetical protein [Bradyrhizobium sp. Oc8]
MSRLRNFKEDDRPNGARLDAAPQESFDAISEAVLRLRTPQAHEVATLSMPSFTR